MPIKALIIAIIQKQGSILMRKKPNGSPPYQQTWYLFGAELTADESPDDTIKKHIKKQTGIDIAVNKEFSWGTEVKHDLDGIEKMFIYLDVLCDYVSGELVPSASIEQLKWVEIKDLPKYDLVPPSVEVFKKLGYL